MNGSVNFIPGSALLPGLHAYNGHKALYMRVLLFLVFSLISISGTLAQVACDVTKLHDLGYTTSISSVNSDVNGNYTIVLLVEHDGCPGPICKGLSHYSVEALPGTYSDISVEVISGNMAYGSIVYGPNLGGDPFEGFKISNTSGIGNGEAGAFTVTYTLSGGLQTQQILVKAGEEYQLVTFTMEEFQLIHDCMNIFPYYPPPEGGKIIGSLIGSELTSLHYVYNNIGNDTLSSDDIFQISADGENVLIDIVYIS